VHRCWGSPRAPARGSTRFTSTSPRLREPPPAGGATTTPDILLRGTAHQLARKFGPRGDVLLRTQNRIDAFSCIPPSAAWRSS
jgi:hypothetical protein